MQFLGIGHTITSIRLARLLQGVAKAGHRDDIRGLSRGIVWEIVEVVMIRTSGL